jgi:hypothetical protein
MNNLNSQQNYHKVDEEQHRQKRGNLLVTAPKGQSVNIPVCEKNLNWRSLSQLD